MCEKTLTVIIPMYNAGKFIQKCLDSLLLPKDAMKYLEVIVVDDGSTDCGAEYVKQYIEAYPDSISILRKQNGGHGSAVNAGVSKCRGKYFKVLDADDWMHTSALQDMVRLLGRIDVQAAVCGYSRYDIRTKKTVHIRVPAAGGAVFRQENAVRTLSMQQLVREWAILRQLFCLHGIIYRTDFYRSLHCQLPEGVFYDDAFFFTVPCSFADRLCIVDRQLYVYRVGDVAQSISPGNRELRAGQLEDVIRAILKTGRQNACKTKAGREYWYRMLVSVVTDYYVTVFLRARNRKRGRKMGRRFLKEIRRTDYRLYQKLWGRYCLLRVMHLLHRDEQDFVRLASLRSRICVGREYGNRSFHSSA